MIAMSSLTLPYIIEDKDRRKPFTRDMEAAAILCLAEAKRKKPGILGAPPEKLSFASKLHYPLWVVPWENECVIVDGLGILSHTIMYKKPPDVKLFVENLERSTTARELFRSALKSNTKTFEDFVETTRISMNSIVANRKILSTISWYMKRGLTLEKSATEPAISIPLRLDEKAAMESAENLFNRRRLIQWEIRGLRYAINILEEETKLHEQKIVGEIEQIRETFDEKISHAKSEVEEKVEQLKNERDAKIRRIFEVSERELKVSLKERAKDEQKLEKLERDKRVFQKRKQIRKSRGNEAGVTYWDHKIEVCKNKISEVKGKIKVLSRFIERTHKQGELGAKKLNESYRGLIVKERKRISDLETLRNSQIETTKKEVEELASDASSIKKFIEQLIEQKKQHASQFKKITIPWRSEGVTLINMPFYVFRYETEEKSRYHVHPPVVATGYEGIIRRIQKTIWSFSLESRIKLLLRPQSKALEKMFTSIFAERVQEDKALEKVVHEMGSSNNLLNVQDLGEALARGADELKVEGWISREERGAILKAYVH
jgi:hypothetical protein